MRLTSAYKPFLLPQTLNGLLQGDCLCGSVGWALGTLFRGIKMGFFCWSLNYCYQIDTETGFHAAERNIPKGVEKESIHLYESTSGSTADL